MMRNLLHDFPREPEVVDNNDKERKLFEHSATKYE